MSLILIRDLAGKGNCDEKGAYVPLKKIDRGDGTTAILRTGGDCLRLETAKADGLVFRPWVIVPCPSGGRQETAILRHCDKMWGQGQSPIVRMDWRDKALVAGYFEHNPDRRLASDPATNRDAFVTEVADLIAATANGADRAPRTVPQVQDIETAPVRDANYSVAPGAAKTAQLQRGREDATEVEARGVAYADGIYKQEYDRHRADGKTEAQAGEYAERSRKAALKRGPDEGAASAATA